MGRKVGIGLTDTLKSVEVDQPQLSEDSCLDTKRPVDEHQLVSSQSVQLEC